MIVLDLDKDICCDNCLRFEADVEKPVIYYADGKEIFAEGDTVIRCANRDFCRHLFEEAKKKWESMEVKTS